MTRTALLTAISRTRARIDKLHEHKTMRAFYQAEALEMRLEKLQRKLAAGDYTDEVKGKREPKLKFKEDSPVFYNGNKAQVLSVIDENTVIIHLPCTGEHYCTDAQNELKPAK